MSYFSSRKRSFSSISIPALSLSIPSQVILSPEKKTIPSGFLISNLLFCLESPTSLRKSNILSRSSIASTLYSFSGASLTLKHALPGLLVGPLAVISNNLVGSPLLSIVPWFSSNIYSFKFEIGIVWNLSPEIIVNDPCPFISPAIGKAWILSFSMLSFLICICFQRVSSHT